MVTFFHKSCFFFKQKCQNFKCTNNRPAETSDGIKFPTLYRTETSLRLVHFSHPQSIVVAPVKIFKKFRKEKAENNMQAKYPMTVGNLLKKRPRK